MDENKRQKTSDKNKREEIKRHINTTFAHLRKIPVSDVYVDYMAVARAELRAAYAMLNEDDGEVEEKDNG